MGQENVKPSGEQEYLFLMFGASEDSEGRDVVQARRTRPAAIEIKVSCE